MLADQNAGFLPLQKLMAQRDATAGRLKDAAEVAARATPLRRKMWRRFVCCVRFRRRRKMGCGAANGNALEAADGWKHTGRGPGDCVNLYAELKPDGAGAIAQLAPYVGEGALPAYRQAALPLYCDGLVVLGKSDEARAILEPLLAGSGKWQSVWLELATCAKRRSRGDGMDESVRRTGSE